MHGQYFALGNVQLVRLFLQASKPEDELRVLAFSNQLSPLDRSLAVAWVYHEKLEQCSLP
jgi:hypothetical protein